MHKRLNESDIRRILAERQVVITDSHFVYSQPTGRGDHGDTYVNKDAIYPDTEAISWLCAELAYRLDPVIALTGNKIAVVGPAIGGVILSTWLGHWIQTIYPRKVAAVYAEKAESGGFVLRRGYDKLVSGRDTIVIEDILNSGGSARDTISAASAAGGNVIAVVALCNRGGVTAESLDVEFLEALVSFDLKKYPEDGCPICQAGQIPVRTDLGHGKDYLKRKTCVAV
jgi:orotate phosphoribosyltransferase